MTLKDFLQRGQAAQAAVDALTEGQRRDPQTPAEWQDAVNAAEACLLLDSARLYGFVTGGPGVNIARCEQILEGGRARQIRSTDEGVDREIAALIAVGGHTMRKVVQ
jgi:hypothetical protein